MADTSILNLHQLVESADDLSFNSYGDIIRYNTNLTTVELWVECIRQWLIIVITIALCILFIHSIRNLKRTQQGIDLDQLILWAEFVKVSVLVQKMVFMRPETKTNPLCILLCCRSSCSPSLNSSFCSTQAWCSAQ